MLAALAFVCRPARESRAPTPLIEASSAIDLDVLVEDVAPQEQAPPARGGYWQGTCRAGELGWPDMPVTLALTISGDGAVDAMGTLAFVGRRTRATLHGGVLDDRFILNGEMREHDGLFTVWRIEVNGRFQGPDRIVGRFVEVYPRDLGGSAVMCTFDLRRSRGPR